MVMRGKISEKLCKNNFSRRPSAGWVPWGAPLLLACSLVALGAARPEGSDAMGAPESSVQQAEPEKLPPCRPCDAVATLGEARQLLAGSPAMAEPLLARLFREAVTPDVAQGAASLLVEAGASDWPKGTQGDFLRALAPEALMAGRATGIPPSVTLAQAILESGWGRSALARDENNLFGVKVGTSTSGSVAARTREGRGRVVTARFRTYPDWRESLLDHNQLLATDARYAGARRHADSWRSFLAAIAPIYASSHVYVSRVSGLVEDYGLDRWDALVREAAAAQTAPSDDRAEALASRG